MKIQQRNTYTPNYNLSEQKVASNNFGRKTISNKSAQKIEDLGIRFDSAMQRGLMGILALGTQPFIDLKNKKVDEETRKASAARTTAKIIAGTTTGVIVREAMIQLTKLFSQNNNILKYEFKHSHKKGEFVEKESFKKWQQFLLTSAKDDAAKIKRTRNAVGTIAAIFVMLYTNFAVDAPLTTYLTNKFYKPNNKPKEVK